MFAPLARAIGFVRGHPMVAVGAGAGALALIVPALNARQKGTEAAVTGGAPAAAAPSAYGAVGGDTGVGSSDLAIGGLSDQLGTQNSAIIGLLSQIQNAIASAASPPTPAPPVGGSGGGVSPPPVAKPPIPGTPVGGAAVNYAGTLTPFGTRFPAYVHTYAQAADWIARALRNGYKLKPGSSAAPFVPPRK